MLNRKQCESVVFACLQFKLFNNLKSLFVSLVEKEHALQIRYRHTHIAAQWKYAENCYVHGKWFVACWFIRRRYEKKRSEL